MALRPIGNTLIPVGTPLHVTNLVTVLLKATFATLGSPDYPFRYTDDIHTTGLMVDSVFNKDSEYWGKKPFVIVSGGDISNTVLATGDIGGIGKHTQNKSKTSMINSSVNFHIASKLNGEVDILRNEIFNFLTTCRTLLPQLTGLHNVNNTAVSPVGQFEQDGPTYFSNGLLAYTIQYKWSDTIPQNILKSVQLNENGVPVFVPTV